MEKPLAGVEELQADRSAQLARDVIKNLRQVMHAPDDTLDQCVLCLLSEGHLIIEDFPGVGKTTLAKALARSIDLSFSRIQFTPDLLPSDVTGVNVFNQRSNEFEFRPGPVFANVLLVDEINRTSPKTQAALLECMQERQVTIDGDDVRARAAVHGHGDAEPDRVRGHVPASRGAARPLHHADRDRLPAAAAEAQMLDRADDAATPLEALEPVTTAEDVLGAIEEREARLRRGEPQPLHRRAPPAHPRRHAAPPRCEPACRDRPPSGREGARARRRARVRRARRREGGRAGRARPPAHPRAGGAFRRPFRRRPRPRDASSERRSRSRGARPRADRPRPLVLPLGGVTYLAAWAFGSRPSIRSPSGSCSPSPRRRSGCDCLAARCAAPLARGRRALRRRRRAGRRAEAGGFAPGSLILIERIARLGEHETRARWAGVAAGAAPTFSSASLAAGTRSRRRASSSRIRSGSSASRSRCRPEALLVYPRLADARQALLGRGRRTPGGPAAAAPADDRVRPPLRPRLRAGRVASARPLAFDREARPADGQGARGRSARRDRGLPRRGRDGSRRRGARLDFELQVRAAGSIL